MLSNPTFEMLHCRPNKHTALASEVRLLSTEDELRSTTAHEHRTVPLIRWK
ncbi:hypothetical protein LINPERPRIM_LOCUS9544 [Linum perenne]